MTVKDTGGMKFAVTLFGPFIARFCGLVVPPKSPLQ
jgi:hypothetical protein